MRTLSLLISVAAGVVLVSAEAGAQSAFVEGHVFNKKTGGPIAAAVVQVFENVTAGPIPIKLGEDVTDANGFYEIEVTEFLDFGADIEVTCTTDRGQFTGRGSAILRDDTIRRDIYLAAPRRLTRCSPTR